MSLNTKLALHATLPKCQRSVVSSLMPLTKEKYITLVYLVIGGRILLNTQPKQSIATSPKGTKRFP